jgi:hypothetical protein
MLWIVEKGEINKIRRDNEIGETNKVRQGVMRSVLIINGASTLGKKVGNEGGGGVESQRVREKWENIVSLT